MKDATKPMTVAEMARLGGEARAESLSAARRREIARMGGEAKGKKHKKEARAK